MSDKKDMPLTPSEDDFSEMVKSYGIKAMSANAPIEGRIVDFVGDRVVVDIGQKTEGILDKHEILEWDGSLKYKVGDVIAVLPKNVNFKEGYIVVSKKQVDILQGWEKVIRAFKNNGVVMGRIVQITPDGKGFIVDMGVEMFLPMSQSDIAKVKVPKKLLGKEYWFKVVKLNKKERSGVVSRRIVQEEEKKEKVKNLLESLQVGQVVKGIVNELTDYGAFVDLGGLDGLLHKENISYRRINHPREKLKRGDELEVKVLEIDREKGKISLGLKQKYPDPWLSINEKYPLGKRVIAKVVKIVKFGAFIELEEGVEGLLHISDMAWGSKPGVVEEYVAVGDKMWVQVIEVDAEAKKIKLGLKQLEIRPEEKYLQKHAIGEIIKGTVKKILKSRVFVGLEEDVEGAIRISDISYFHIESPEDVLQEGQEVEAMILSDELDKNFKVQLSLKHLAADEWKSFYQKNRSGNIISVLVKKVTDRGIVVEISKNIEGFVRLMEVEEGKTTFEEIQQRIKPGDQREALILKTEPDKKKIYLSFKAVDRIREREDLEKYMKSSDGSVTTVGDLLQNEIQKMK